jgi:beta-phosphoglucomutase
LRNDRSIAVLWDMDGTLVDTAEHHFHAWVRICREYGKEFTRADFTATFGKRNPEIIDYLFDGKIQGPEADKLGHQKEEYYRAESTKTGIELLPGVLNLLKSLNELGAKQAIGSSAPRGNLELILKLTGIGKYMQAMVGMEDTQRGKPDPQVFLIGAEKLKIQPQNSVVVEDAIAGVQAAKAGGMKCIAVSFVGHHSEEKLKSAGADRIVKTLSELDGDDFYKLVWG